MGLNRFYTKDGKILSIGGSPIGYEYIPYPTDGLFSRFTWEDSIDDTKQNINWTDIVGTYGFGEGPAGSRSLNMGTSYFIDKNWTPYKGDLSFFTWVKTTSTQDNALMSTSKVLNPTSYSDLGLSMFYRAANSVIRTSVASSTVEADYPKPATWSTDTWHHYGFTIDDTTGTLRAYYDGTLMKSATVNTVGSDQRWFFLGMHYYSNKNKDLALTYFYKKTLSQEEINKLYVEGGGVPA
jgi:hypothetical protein